MSERLLSFSEVILYGRLVEDLQIVESGSGDSKGKGGGKNPPKELSGVKNPTFARIYGFSYDGAYYELPSPALFLVDGNLGKSAAGQRVPPNNAARAPARTRLPRYGG